MKKKIDFRIILIVILTIIFFILTYLYFNPNALENFSVQNQNSAEESDSTSTSEASVEIKTIMNTISSSGEISSSLTENLELHATYYFSEIYFEENEKVEEGENILKYTNGTYMTAPYDLVITKINVPKEDEKCTNSHYITVCATDVLNMSVKIDEDEIGKISVGQEAQITLTANEETVLTGYVTDISSSASYSGNGSKFTATVEFRNDGNVAVGMSGMCEIILEKAENVIAVPTEAVETENSQKYVTVIENGNTKQVNVTTGISNDAYIEIKSGLEGNETVQITKQTSSSNSGFRGMNQSGMGDSSQRKQERMEQMQGGTPPSMPQN